MPHTTSHLIAAHREGLEQARVQLAEIERRTWDPWLARYWLQIEDDHLRSLARLEASR